MGLGIFFNATLGATGLTRSKFLLVLALASIGQAPHGQAQPAAPPSAADPMTLISNEHATVKARLDATVAGYAYTGTWFGLASLNSANSFSGNRAWGEGWLNLGIEAVARLHTWVEAYAGVGVGASGTLGADSYDQRNQGAISLENAFAGLRTRNPASSWNIDVSSGQQDYGVGTGMLIWQGAGNGFERGAGGLMPRLAWENATVARVSYGGLSVDAFYLDPNELPSGNTHTRLAGGVAQYRWGEQSRVGLAGLHVLESDMFYPLPRDPAGIPGGRKGLDALQGFAEIEGSNFGVKNAWLRGEFAIERNRRIDMAADAWYGEAGYRFVTLPLVPAISYAYAHFSGDNPSTARYERFDPLYYGNGLNNWWFGASSAYAFLNSNVDYHRVTLQLVATPRDYLKVQYLRALADRLSSPIQFGQATRPVVTPAGIILTNGVANHHLDDEVYVEWAHVFNPHWTTALWGSVAMPGQGIRDLPNVNSATWCAAGITLKVKY